MRRTTPSPTFRSVHLLLAAGLGAAILFVAVSAPLATLFGQEDEAPWRKLREDPPKPAALEETFETCLTCHEDEDTKPLENGEELQLGFDLAAMKASVHGKFLDCLDCHAGYDLNEDWEHPLTPAKSRKEFRALAEETCRSCHSDTMKAFGAGAHSKAADGPGCVECHGAHAVQSAGIPAEKVGAYCGRCHADAAKELAASAHAEMEITCLDCHGAHEVRGDLGVAGVTKKCAECHDEPAEKYAGSSHAEIEVGCKDCHGVHGPKGLDAIETRMKLCGDCHEEAVEQVMAGPHGKQEAGACGACHDVHGAGKQKIGGERLGATCGRCHEDASKEHAGSAHASAELSCSDCHGIHELKGYGLDASGVTKLCAECHEDAAGAYAGSVHESEVELGCGDCHGIHGARGFETAEAAAKACGECHEEPVEGLKRGAHGAAGGPSCSACHDAHAPSGKGWSHEKNVEACGKCHEDPAKEYAAGAHCCLEGGPSCADCHGFHEVGGGDLTVKEETEACAKCHGEVAKIFADSAHGMSEKGPSCTACHGTHHTDWVEKIPPVEEADFCGKCHEAVCEAYDQNVHQIALENGKENAPTCVSCHGAHTMKTVKSAHEGWALQFFLVECRKCHQTFCDIVNEHDWLYNPAYHFQERLICADCHVPDETDIKGHVLRADVKPVFECERCHDRSTLLVFAQKGKDFDLSLDAILEGFTPETPYVVGADPISGPDIVGIIAVLATLAGMPLAHGGLRFLAGMLRKNKS